MSRQQQQYTPWHWAPLPSGDHMRDDFELDPPAEEVAPDYRADTSSEREPRIRRAA